MGPNYDKLGTIDIPTSRETLQLTEMGNLAPALYEKLEKLEAKVADLDTRHARESRTGGNVIKEGESFQSKDQLRKLQDHENSIDKYFHNNFKNYRQYRVRPTWSMFPNDYMNFLNKEIEALLSYGKVQEDLIHRLLFNIFLLKHFQYLEIDTQMEKLCLTLVLNTSMLF